MTTAETERPAKEAVKAEAQESLKKFLDRHRQSIVDAASNRISPERVLKVALLAATKMPLLTHDQMDRVTVLRAVVTAASLGLEPGSALGEGYLVPYFNKNRKLYECEFLIGYRGYVTLARRSGSISGVDSRPVFEGEKFEPHYGTDPKIIHIPDFSIARTPEKLVAVYTVWKLTEGGSQFDVMSKAEVEVIHKRSKAADSGPWVTDYIEMAKKTVTRRSSKLVPMSTEMAEAIDDDARREFGDLDLGTVVEEAGERKGANEKLAGVLGVGTADAEKISAHARMLNLVRHADTPGVLTIEEMEDVRQFKIDHPDWKKMLTPEPGTGA